MTPDTITVDVYNFLKRFPPFDLMKEAELLELSLGVKMKHFASREAIIRKGDESLDYFFVINKGSILITENQEGENILIDQCDEGDIFGVRASIAQDEYIADATAEEDSLLYIIPMPQFNKIMASNFKVSLFLTAGFASGLSILKSDHEDNVKNVRRLLEKKDHFTSQLLETDALNINSQKQIIDCSPQHTVREAAKIMSIFNVGSILITDKQKHPLGIITDSDFRRKVVAADEIIKDKLVDSIMSSPVKTIRPNLSVAEVMLKMISNRVTHLVVTEDGTPNSPALGIASQRDVLIAQGNNPSVLLKQILKVKEVSELAKIRTQAESLIESYLNQEVGVPFISNIITEINDVLIQKANSLAIEKLREEGLEPPNVKYCWLSLGSEGRREQLLRTDQDNALVYEDPQESEATYTKEYFLKMSREITNTLIKCGFVKCPADMMASNPQWCQPISQWKKYFKNWISQSEPQSVLHTTIFFDFRPISGDESLAHELKEFIFQELDKNEIFLSILAKNALQNPPPLSFFRSFIVEKGGIHKNEFDIKARAMMPLTDAARVLAYSFKIKNYASTSERFEEVAKLDKNLTSLCESAAMAYEILLKHRAISGLKNKNSGRYINPEQFNKFERQTIRSTFKTIEKIQQVLEVRYRLSFIR
jgi:CBS domain-containing protein